MMGPFRSSWRFTAVGLLITLALVAWPAVQAQAALAKVTGVTLQETATQVQLSIAASGPVGYQLRDVQPDWIVVDIVGAELAVPSGELPNDSMGLVKKVRVGQFAPGLARVVVELIQPIQFSMSTSADSTKIVVAIPTEVGDRPIPTRAQLVKQLPTAQLPAPPQPGKPAPAGQVQPAAPQPAPVVSSQKLINLELRNADITDVLSALAKLVGANIVTDSEVKGRITVRLLNVTFDEALRLILEPNDLGYEIVGNNILVGKKEKLTHPILRQYTLTNITPSVFVATVLPMTGLKKEQVIADDSNNSILVLGAADDQARVQELLARVDLPTDRQVTRVIKMSYMDGATFLDLLGSKLPPDVVKGAKFDKASNSVVITATVAQMAQVDAMLQQLDTPLSQVLIEAMVVEVPTEVIKNLGLAWQNVTTFTITSTGVDSNNIPIVSVTAPPIVTVLNTQIQENKSRLLANPRLAVRDGETATMNIGDKIPFQVVNATGVASLVIIDAGVILEITPRVNADGYITIRMHPQVSAIKTPPSAGVPPTISTREAESSLTVKDGTSIVLAGLIQKNETRTTVKVPLLGDIPVLGWLFSSTSTDNTDNEIVFVITPHILQKVGS